jgi:hypothetical protein
MQNVGDFTEVFHGPVRDGAESIGRKRIMSNLRRSGA